jgi:hypothetical protein
VAPKRIEIFKPGRQRTTAGELIEFTEADLKAAAAAYNPSLHEAPLVVGHPAKDGPAYGWVERLQAGDDGLLSIEPRQVEATFAEMVNEGRFKKVSAAWYRPTASNNPVPGTWYLRHVGFLGAQPPAVKGLKDASFAAAADEGVVEFADWGFATSRSLFQRLRDWLISREGLEQADKLIPQWEIDSLGEAATAAEYRTAPEQVAALAAAAAAAAQPTSVFPTYSEGASTMTPEQLAAEQARLATLQADIAAREAALKASERAARLTGYTEFCEGLVREGRLPSGQVKRLAAFMDSLPTDSMVVEFGEGDTKTERPCVQVFQEFLKAMPKLVEFGESAKPGPDKQVDLNDHVAIGAAAVQFQEAEAKEGRTVDVIEAVEHVMKQNAVA